MQYPKFFDTIETITLQDDLSDFLGTFQEGMIELSYLDVVKAAGHSCPTIAGAYLMALIGLKTLYQNQIPKRGEIFVAFQEDAKEGVTGVIANVITHITGATESSGFKGINDHFARYELMKFNADIHSSIKFQRLDTGATVELIYNPTNIPGNPRINLLMQKWLSNTATEVEKKEFGTLWQQRVETIFHNKDKVITILE